MQLIANRSMAAPLRELRELTRSRLLEGRNVVGFDIAGMRMIARIANERKTSYLSHKVSPAQDIWAGIGLGSDIAAALEGRNKKR
jgi:hypothetical protein